MTDEQKKRGSGPFLVVLLGSVVVTALVTALLLNISDRNRIGHGYRISRITMRPSSDHGI